MQAVTASCEAAGLQAVPALVSKCLQLQDTLAVRFGVMLVGPAGMSVPTENKLQLYSVLCTMLRWRVVHAPCCSPALTAAYASRALAVLAYSLNNPIQSIV